MWPRTSTVQGLGAWSAPVPRSRDRGRCLGLWGDTPGMAPSATALGLPCQALSVKSTIRLPSDIGPGEAGGPWRIPGGRLNPCTAGRRGPAGGHMPDDGPPADSMSRRAEAARDWARRRRRSSCRPGRTRRRYSRRRPAASRPPPRRPPSRGRRPPP